MIGVFWEDDMRTLFFVCLGCLIGFSGFFVVKSINDHRNEWNAFLEANNCVELKTAPALRETKCYICGDGITYCK